MYPPHDLQIFRLDFAIEFSKDPPGSLPVDSTSAATTTTATTTAAAATTTTTTTSISTNR